jgi:hypothetical protein
MALAAEWPRLPLSGFLRKGFPMTPGQTLRFACGDCQVVFDICVAPVSEWAEEIDPDDFDGRIDIGEPASCPFCGSSEIKVTHDRAVQVLV